MRKAIIESETGKVLNVIILSDSWTGTKEGDWQPPEGTKLVDAEKDGAPGNFWNGNSFISEDPDDS